MKKIINLFFIFAIGFLLILKVNALSVSLPELTESLGEYCAAEYDANVTKNNTNFKAIIDDFEYDDGTTLNTYTFELNYQNNIISLVSSDNSKLNNKEKFIKGYLDLDLLNTLFSIIDEKYEDSDFDLETSIEENTLSKYGIELVFENLSTEDDNSLGISKFTVNLNTFESAIKTDISTENKKEETPEVDGDIPQTEEPTVEKDPIAEDENATNPDTGDSTIYIIISFLVICVGLIIYKFKSLDNYNRL